MTYPDLETPARERPALSASVGLYAGIYALAFLFFMNISLSRLLGPVLLMLLLLVAARPDGLGCLPLLALANDALGTMFLGNLAFAYAAPLVLIVHLFAREGTKRFHPRDLLGLTVALAIMLQAYVMRYASTSVLRSTILYAAPLGLALSDLMDDEERLSSFLHHFGITVTLLALHAVITGGVKYFDADEVRCGILGTGVGDPNFSGMKLVAGLAMVLCWKPLAWYFQLPMLVILALGLMQTVSITGMLMLALVIVLYALLQRGAGKRARILLGLMLAVVGVVFLIYSTGLHETDPQLRLLVERIEEKLVAFINGDMNNVTSNRSSVFARMLDHFLSQPLSRQFFGNVAQYSQGSFTHNTYLDMFYRFGYVFTPPLLAFIAWRALAALSRALETGRREVFLLKVVYLGFGASLSVNYGPDGVLWWLVVLLL